MNVDSLKTNLSKLMQCTHCTAVYGAVVNQEERFEVVPLLDIKYLRKIYLLVRFFELTLYCSWATALLWSL